MGARRWERSLSEAIYIPLTDIPGYSNREILFDTLASLSVHGSVKQSCSSLKLSGKPYSFVSRHSQKKHTLPFNKHFNWLRTLYPAHLVVSMETSSYYKVSTFFSISLGRSVHSIITKHAAEQSSLIYIIT